jgi:hypothetical protein
MTIHVREWVQDEWVTGNVGRYAQRGDFGDLRGLAPSHNRHRLERAPKWADHLEHSGLVDVRGMFYDEINDRYVLVGTKSANSRLASGYFNAAWSFAGPYELVTTIDDLGGVSMQNLRYWDDALWAIGDDQNVYRGTNYLTTLSSFDAGGDAQILVPCGGRMYMITNTGAIERQDDAGTAFEAYLAPVVDYTPIFATPYKGYLLVVGMHYDGRLSIYRVSLPIATYLQEIATILTPQVNVLDAGCQFIVHEDVLYFTPGPIDGVPGSGEHTVELWQFDGTRLSKVCEFVETAEVSDGTAGLLTWHDKLIYYVMHDDDVRFRVYAGGTFTRYVPSSGIVDTTELSINSIAASLNDAIIVTSNDLQDNEGIQYAIGQQRYSDVWFDTCWLDFGHPGKLKRLESINVLVDGSDEDFNVVIKYHTDDEGSSTWHTAYNAGGTAICQVTNLGVEFTRLQVRVELVDGSEENLDVGIEAISVIYTVDD